MTLRNRAEAKLLDILTALETINPNSRPLSLMSGRSGLILFYFYLARMRSSDALYDIGFQYLNQNLDFLEEYGANHFTYCNGVAGFGVLFKLLTEHTFLDTDPEDVLDALDEAVVESTQQQLLANNLDFLHGAVGNAFYLLMRAGTTATDPCLRQLIEQLQTTAIADADGIRWLEPESVRNPLAQGTINMSLSHGLCSKIIFLAKCVAQQVASEQCTYLLEGCIRFLRLQADWSRSVNVYPSAIAADHAKEFDNRLAWCYGDLGVVVALLFAGKVLNQPAWIQEGIALGLHACSRTTIEQTSLVDTEFCHGTAGVAHIFNRLYTETALEPFEAARDYWLEQTLIRDTFPDGLAGYKTHRSDGWVTEPALLEGIVGVGLVLQSYLQPNADLFSWDSVFLLDLPGSSQ
ncbi:lanthionine synthetase C family protein [Hymenobacter rubripertinctus]|uniref:Lanthionine synthetase n=1 Tax=Hymenobacter rubripertinctus TaxID=2029981 RepID=A0A418QX37_9BACT|nr:lanthionine synthetase C family protein [Hymenobacter rubripertinctus]RIY09723.1 hypothetical protein D0T11_11105 [Hymenobacter rubripertinctus]